MPKTEADEYAELIECKIQAENEATTAGNALWRFMDDHADRKMPKPYDICGADDGQGQDHLECQLPQNHRQIGYRNHLEMRDGKIWGAWS